MMEAFRPPYSTGQGNVSQRRCASFLLNCRPNSDCWSARNSVSESNWSCQPGGSSSFRNSRTSARNVSSSAVNLTSIVPPCHSERSEDARFTVGGRPSCYMSHAPNPSAPACSRPGSGDASDTRSARRRHRRSSPHGSRSPPLPRVFRQPADCGDHSRHDPPVFVPYRCRRWQVLPGDDQEVHRRLPPGILAGYIEGHDQIVFVHLVDWHRSPGNPTEQAVTHCHPWLAASVALDVGVAVVTHNPGFHTHRL